ncbi:MAG: TetR family transcriptional regulator [Syntrophaceae bacterium]|nr:TetR family transcriptional regulator [Syntrophaceae bacterium]
MSTKELILKVAGKLFSTKGFLETKISDISFLVEVTDSTIYEHFKNKEDILFAIPEEKTQKLIENNEQHLKGLVGAEIKLRKLIWNYFDFLANDREYTTLLIFELRPNRDFYDTDHQKLIRQFIQEYRKVIVEGQNNGEFRSDIRPSIILNLIFGTIDQILITWLVENKPSDPLSLFEDLFDLIKHAIAKDTLKKESEDKRNKILDAAAKVFSEYGYNKARIQDIAKLAGLGDATVYNYFSSKEDILFTLPIEKTKELLSIQTEHLNGIKRGDLRLKVLITDYLHYLESHREYSSTCLFDLRYKMTFYQKEAYNLFRDFARVFYNTILDGIAKDEFRPSLNPYVATKMIFGVIDHSLLSSLKFGRPERLTSISDPINTLILSSFKKR